MTTDTGPSPDATAGPPPPTPPKHHRARQLVRRPHEGPIAGVCAGVAEYFHVDPNIVRIAAVVLAFTGPGVPAYLLAWVFVPAAGHRSIAAAAAPRGSTWDRSSQAVGIGLLIVAVSILWGDWWSPAPRWFIPIGLVGLGVWLLVRRDREDDPTLPGITTDPPSWRSPAVAAAAATIPVDGDLVDDATTETAVETPDANDGDATATASPSSPPWALGDDDGAPPSDPPPTYDGPPLPPIPSHRRRRRMIGPIVSGALLVWGGIAWLAGVEIEDALAVGLCIIGVGFVLGAFLGGSWGLMFPALLVGGALVVTSVIDIPFEGGIRDRTWTVEGVDDLQDSYEVGIGQGTLDLSRIAVDDGDVVEVRASVGIGELVVHVPEGVNLEVDSELGVGKAEVLGRSDDGFNVDAHRTIEGDSDLGTLRLDLQVGIGHIEVEERMGFRDRELVPR